jgi:CheY-like chemotaxis protein
MSETLFTGWTILVIDDEPDSIKLLELLLARTGAAVISAVNGAEGLRLAREHLPKLILSDLSMPEMSGWAFVEALRADAQLAHIPVIALTAHAMSGDREKVLGAGFQNYLTKPLKPRTFNDDLVALLMQIPELAREIKR